MQSKTYRANDLEFFAEDGLIHMIHKNPQTGEPFERVVPISEIEARVQALAEIEKKLYLKYSLVANERDFYNSSMKFLKICQDLIKDAKEQGDPLNPKVLAELTSDATRSEKYTMKP